MVETNRHVVRTYAANARTKQLLSCILVDAVPWVQIIDRKNTVSSACLAPNANVSQDPIILDSLALACALSFMRS